MKARLFLLICFASIVSSCTTSTLEIPQAEAGKLGIQETVSEGNETELDSAELTSAKLRLLEVAAGDYRLGGGDVISLWSNDIVGLNRSFVLGPDGKVTIPEAGVVSIVGLSREEAMVKIEEQLKANYRHPKVSLLIESYNNNRVSVLGEVRDPGEYSFAASPSLLTVLAKAGGPTPEADLKRCTIIRGRNAILEVDLRDLLRKGNLALNIPLLPNDSIYIKPKPPEKAKIKGTFFVLGEVKNPGVFSTPQKDEERMDPLRAISLAGGSTEDAELNEVRIVRRNTLGPPSVFKVNLENLLDGGQTGLPAVLAGDLVYVPRRGLATFR